MSIYDNHIANSDLNAFKFDGNEDSTSITFSGTLTAGDEQTETSAWVDIVDLDYFQARWRNDQWNSTKAHDITLSERTYVDETTFSSPLECLLRVQIQEDRLRFQGRIVNPYSSNVSLVTTTITFNLVGYEDTTLSDTEELAFSFRTTSGADSRVTSTGDVRITVL